MSISWQVPQAMGTLMSLTGAATSNVYDQDQRQIQLTARPCFCPQRTHFLVPLGHVSSPSWALVLEAALGLNSEFAIRLIVVCKWLPFSPCVKWELWAKHALIQLPAPPPLIPRDFSFLISRKNMEAYRSLNCPLNCRAL